MLMAEKNVLDIRHLIAAYASFASKKKEERKKMANQIEKYTINFASLKEFRDKKRSEKQMKWNEMEKESNSTMKRE